MSSPSDAVVNFPADEVLSRSLLEDKEEDKENVVTSVSAVQEIVTVEEVLVQDVSVAEIVGNGATAVSDVGSGVVAAPEDGVSLAEAGADVGTGVDNIPPVSDIAYSELADMQSADIAAAIEPVSVLEEVPAAAAAAAAESAVSLEEDDDHRVLTSEALPTKEDITFVDPSIVPESLPFEEVPPDDTIPLNSMADPSIAASVLAAAEDDERTAQEVQKAEELGAVTAEIVKDDEKKEEQEATVVRVVEESVSVLQTRVIVEEVVPSTGEVLAQNVTEATIVDRETMTETALLQAAAGIVDGSAIAVTGEKEETMAVEETAVKKRSRDETFVSEEARALAEQLPVAAADAVDETLAVAGEEGDVPAVKRVKSDAAAGGDVEADVEQNNGSSKAVDDTQVGEEHRGDVVQGGGADSLQQEEAGKEEEQMPAAELKLGPKLFLSSIELFSYLYDLLHGWVVNTDLNKYEFLVVSELLKEGAPHKVGAGISAIQVRMHPSWKSRCYYLIRSDGSVDDFSYRKCVEKLLPLPKSLFLPNGELDLDKVVPGAKGKNRDKENGSFDGAAKGRGGGRGGWAGRGFQGVRGGRGGRGGHGKGGRWT